MLHQREQDLRQRRQHVEHLIRWHQRLDAEEQAVLDMERRLMAHTNTASHHQQTAQATLHRKQIANIEHSLEVLQSMSGRRSINDDDDRSATDRVKMSGSKLNRLWRRLTGEATLKFDTSRRYVLTKVDIERLYEEAMRVVLLQFADGGPRVLDQTMNSTVATLESGGGARNQMGDEFVVVPSLNLEFSFADEELSTINTDGEKSGSAAVGYYFSDAAPGSAGRSNSEAKSATVETSVSEEHYTSEGFATASESKEQTAEDSSRSTRLPIPEVLENRLLVPNETFISDISCPPFDITERSASALDVDTSAVTAEHSYRNAVVDDNKDQQSPTIAADCQLGSSSRLDNDADSVSSAATATRSLEMPQPIDGAIGVESGSASELVEHIEIDRSESSTVVEESLIVEESSEGSPSVHAEEISAEPTTGESVSEASHSIGPLNDGSKVIGSGVEMTVGAAQLVAPRDYVGPTMEKPASKMPDIISEAEVLRRQQMKIEQEVCHFTLITFKCYVLIFSQIAADQTARTERAVRLPARDPQQTATALRASSPRQPNDGHFPVRPTHPRFSLPARPTAPHRALCLRRRTRTTNGHQRDQHLRTHCARPLRPVLHRAAHPRCAHTTQPTAGPLLQAAACLLQSAQSARVHPTAHCQTSAQTVAQRRTPSGAE